MSSTNFSSFYPLSWIFSQATFGLTKIYSICFTHNEVWAKTAKLIYYYINFLFQEIYCFNSRHGTMVLWCHIQYKKKQTKKQSINKLYKMVFNKENVKSSDIVQEIQFIST